MKTRYKRITYLWEEHLKGSAFHEELQEKGYVLKVVERGSRFAHPGVVFFYSEGKEKYIAVASNMGSVHTRNNRRSEMRDMFVLTKEGETYIKGLIMEQLI